MSSHAPSGFVPTKKAHNPSKKAHDDPRVGGGSLVVTAHAPASSSASTSAERAEAERAENKSPSVQTPMADVQKARLAHYDSAKANPAPSASGPAKPARRRRGGKKKQPSAPAAAVEENKTPDAVPADHAFREEYDLIAAVAKEHRKGSNPAVYHANAALFRRSALVASTGTHSSGAGGSKTSGWIGDACNKRAAKGHVLKVNDAEMHALTELEQSNVGLRGGTVVMFGAHGACSSCKENMKIFAKYHGLRLIVAYTEPYKEYHLATHSFADGWSDAEKVGDYFFRTYDERR